MTKQTNKQTAHSTCFVDSGNKRKRRSLHVVYFCYRNT